jgi:hypothetical protein
MAQELGGGGGHAREVAGMGVQRLADACCELPVALGCDTGGRIRRELGCKRAGVGREGCDGSEQRGKQTDSRL